MPKMPIKSRFIGKFEMTALGQKRKSMHFSSMAALPAKADTGRSEANRSESLRSDLSVHAFNPRSLLRQSEAALVSRQ
jgi:hypothetical protein